ncbi:MAG: hypothetical protein II504_10560, partial [Clostridia bacterium]|nr:hypothetical protein [Clostridia bacterium]
MEKNRIVFTDGWKFSLTDDRQAVYRSFQDDDWNVVDLPHDWQIDQPRTKEGLPSQGFFPREQVGVYRLHFTPDPSWQGKTVRVLFDGVQHFSSVFLNDQEVGGRPYGYVPFLCDLTGGLRYGEDNVLAVRVDNTDPSDGKWYGHGGDRWYSGAGIYRNVWLLVQDECRIAHDGVRVVASPINHGPKGDVPDVEGIRCDQAHVTVTAEVEHASHDVSLRMEIRDSRGDCVYTDEKPADAEVLFDFLMQKPLLWTTEAPVLYSLEICLFKKDQVLDAHRVRFGVRSAVFDEEDGFVLNGVKTKMFGVNLHHDGGAVGAAVPLEIWKRRLETLKSLGVNTIRASHNP